MIDFLNKANEENFSEKTLEYKENKTLDLTDLYIYNSDRNRIIGGCPRQSWYKAVGFTTSNLTLSAIENKEKDKFILNYTISKLEKYFKKNKYKTKKLNTLKLLGLSLNFSNSIEFYDYEEYNIAIVIKANTSKLFNDENNYIYFLPIIFSILSIYSNVYIILKNTYTFEEKVISYGHYNKLIKINGVEHPYNLHKCFQELKVGLSYLSECIEKRKIPTLVNANKCNSCLYKNFCKTM